MRLQRGRGERGERWSRGELGGQRVGARRVELSMEIFSTCPHTFTMYARTLHYVSVLDTRIAHTVIN